MLMLFAWKTKILNFFFKKLIAGKKNNEG